MASASTWAVRACGAPGVCECVLFNAEKDSTSLREKGAAHLRESRREKGSRPAAARRAPTVEGSAGCLG